MLHYINLISIENEKLVLSQLKLWEHKWHRITHIISQSSLFLCVLYECVCVISHSLWM